MLPPGTLYGRKMKACYTASGKHISHCRTKTGRGFFFFLNCNSQINVEQMEQLQKLYEATEKQSYWRKRQWRRNRRGTENRWVVAGCKACISFSLTIYTSFSLLQRLNYCWIQSTKQHISQKNSTFIVHYSNSLRARQRNWPLR